MITFSDIYEASRKERYSEQLQKFPKSFIKDVAGYMKEKREIASKEDDSFSDIIVKTKKQLEGANTLFREWIIRRRKKILSLVLIAAETGIAKQDFDNMFDFEKELFEDLMKCIDISDKKMEITFNGNGIEKEQKNELIIFNEDIEGFVGLDGEKMGPFSKGQMVNLPKEIAKILIEDKKAEKVEE